SPPEFAKRSRTGARLSGVTRETLAPAIESVSSMKRAMRSGWSVTSDCGKVLRDVLDTPTKTSLFPFTPHVTHAPAVGRWQPIDRMTSPTTATTTTDLRIEYMFDSFRLSPYEGHTDRRLKVSKSSG